MIAEYKKAKETLVAAIEQADAQLHENIAAYAVLKEDDPLAPFDIRWIHRRGEESDDARLINERLFDKAFIQFGYKEVRNENNLEGVIYAPIEELFSKKDIIGVADRSLFDEDEARVRMAHEADDGEEDQTGDAQRFAYFLRLLDGRVLDGEPQKMLSADEVSRVCGFVFQYYTGPQADAPSVLAFQRVQGMWIQQQSAYLLFDGAQAAPQPFARKSIRLGSTFDFVLYGKDLFFRNMRALEVLFKFNELVSKRAKDYADSFDGVLADFEELDKRIEASRGVANRLLKIQRDGSPVVDMHPEDIEYHINRISYYSRKFKLNEEGKIMLTTSREVNDFLRMLNDDYLVSPLSNESYEARTKKPLRPDDQDQ